MKVKKVLIVDDDELICNLYSEFLEQSGYDVITAKNVAKALKLIKNQSIDLIIADIVMLNKDGFDLYDELQVINPKLPFIFITGYDNDEAILKRLNQLHVKWLAKPVKLHNLLEIIRAEFVI